MSYTKAQRKSSGMVGKVFITKLYNSISGVNLPVGRSPGHKIVLLDRNDPMSYKVKSGDVVRVRITSDMGRFYFGRVESIITEHVLLTFPSKIRLYPDKRYGAITIPAPDVDSILGLQEKGFKFDGSDVHVIVLVPTKEVTRKDAGVE